MIQVAGNLSQKRLTQTEPKTQTLFRSNRDTTLLNGAAACS